MSEEKQPSAKAARTAAYRWIVLAVLVIAVGGAMFFRSDRTNRSPAPPDQGLVQPPVAVADPNIAEPAAAKTEPAAVDPEPSEALPRLVDLGAHKCIPCKMMAPILEELRQEYAGRFEVIFIDVWQNKSEAQKYGIRLIPTQIFYDATGKELFRHQGFFSKEDILKTWREHGFDFAESKAVAESS